MDLECIAPIALRIIPRAISFPYDGMRKFIYLHRNQTFRWRKLFKSAAPWITIHVFFCEGWFWLYVQVPLCPQGQFESVCFILPPLSATPLCFLFGLWGGGTQQLFVRKTRTAQKRDRAFLSPTFNLTLASKTQKEKLQWLFSLQWTDGLLHVLCFRCAKDASACVSFLSALLYF